MTAPTTRADIMAEWHRAAGTPTTNAEFDLWLAILLAGVHPDDWVDMADDDQQFFREKASDVRAALDIFATVCPREPTEEMVATAGQCELTVPGFTKRLIATGIAASPFAPENADG